ncbi:sigma factor [Brachyspira sp. G79]|uniref:sigma factor n=1 Tax=Brachyspira sp. G79 TaxID=1358104 RepID=UPI001F0B44C1|nr:sigma factor [Brachyspira sp. G79]
MIDNDKIPNITNENEDEYWKEFKNTQSTYIREALINKYSPLVKYAAGKISVNISSHKHIEFQDLLGFGSFGFMDTINKYNPNIGIKFETYALDKIRGIIYDELKKINYLSGFISDVAYVGDNSNDKINSEYLAEGENVKNKILDTLKKLPEKENKYLYYIIIMILH